VNGGEALFNSLVRSGVKICFANPGTTEVDLAVALEKVPEMRAVLALHENVATGAADGYARMTGKPACTLLHRGSGLANGLSNLHHARRAGSPVVNIVGEQAISHPAHDTGLTCDIVGIARIASDCVCASPSAHDLGYDGARAVQLSLASPGKVATLIVPADTSWQEADAIADPLASHAPPIASDAAVQRVAALLGAGRKAAILLGGQALLERGLTAAGKLAAHSGARLFCDTFAPRVRRGVGLVPVERLPDLPEEVADVLAGTELLILVGARPPAGGVASRDRPGWNLVTLSHAEQDGVGSLEALVSACDASATAPQFAAQMIPDMPLPDARLTTEGMMRIVARHLPDDAILADESPSRGLLHHDMITAGSAPHDFLHVAEGATGSMMAVSTGAALACLCQSRVQRLRP
jgi:acetolactate synthase I/II/III large subunit